MVSSPFLPAERIFLRQRVINVSAEANSVLIKTLSSTFFAGSRLKTVVVSGQDVLFGTRDGDDAEAVALDYATVKIVATATLL